VDPAGTALRCVSQIHLGPKQWAPWRRMLARVPTGMSPACIGMIAVQWPLMSHLWCEPTLLTTCAVGSSLLIRRTTCFAVTA